MNQRIRAIIWAKQDKQLLFVGSTPTVYFCQKLNKSLAAALGESPIPYKEPRNLKKPRGIDMKNANNRWNTASKMEKNESRYAHSEDEQTTFKITLTYCKIANSANPWDYTISSRPTLRSGKLTTENREFVKNPSHYWRAAFSTKNAAIEAINAELENFDTFRNLGW